MPRVPLAVVLVASAAVLVGCGADDAERPPLALVPPPAPLVTVTMADHRFELDPDIPAGRVVFRFRNAGKVPHNVVMVPLPDDVPPIEVQLRGSRRRFIEPFAGIYDRRPGDTGTFAVDLLAGRRYAVLCTVSDGDQPHWAQGMVTEFRPVPTPNRRAR